MNNQPILITAEEAAEITAFSERQIKKWSTECDSPCIPYIKINRSTRYLREEIEAWLYQVVQRGTVDDRELALITSDLMKQRPGPYNDGRNGHNASSSLCHYGPEAPGSHKGKGQNKQVKSRKCAEGDADARVAQYLPFPRQ